MQKYEKPEFKCIKFEVEDVITTSNGEDSWQGGGNELPPIDFTSIDDVDGNIDLMS